jgi:hypothetical protein
VAVKTEELACPLTGCFLVRRQADAKRRAVSAFPSPFLAQAQTGASDAVCCSGARLRRIFSPPSVAMLVHLLAQCRNSCTDRGLTPRWKHPAPVNYERLKRGQHCQ